MAAIDRGDTHIPALIPSNAEHHLHGSVVKHWVTIKSHDGGKGTHIDLDGSGNIVKGPPELTGKHISEVAGKGKSSALAKDAAESEGVDHEDVAGLMPHAHQFLLGQHNERETAKKNARKVTGMTANTTAYHENQGKDHSTVRNFDTASRTVAMENPELGFDPEHHETPAKVWNLIREGSKKPPKLNSAETANLAAKWAKGSGKITIDHHDSGESF